ncbi:hypothetical protein H6G89_14645 [Oscillatoria sp. FACHB-1407]|uniref:hypothetical protein n=1 Tax=Oscillatoria sp. FACHB-1407 TaxID=2692847 RepID=UPI00168872D8|nr:hypothetical protein [Oscillatoria sp. FACHB-1407]MBD2462284.1 hypothetical protein [Oscillatoria sp. FACHB-1407]
MQQTTIIPNIKQLPRIPKRGTIYVSVNLAIADPGKVWELAKQLGFSPELAYLETRAGIEIHALLHESELQIQSLAESHGLDPQIEGLMDGGIDPEALRIAYGNRTVKAA